MKNISIPGKVGSLVFLIGATSLIIIEILSKFFPIQIDNERVNELFFLLIFISLVLQLFGVFLEYKVPTLRQVGPLVLLIGLLIALNVVKLM